METSNKQINVRGIKDYNYLFIMNPLLLKTHITQTFISA